jgi:Family of unknown function (DUF6314)
VQQGPQGPYQGGRGGGIPAATSPLAGTLAFLRGRWRLERSLADHVSGCSGTFAGVALFDDADEDGVLRYRELGELRLGDHRGPARRELLFAGRSDGTADVRFTDGRPFYRLDLRARTWHAEHVCGRDLYAVTWQVLDDDALAETWTARGPAKDYQLMTTLTRLDEDAAPARPHRSRRS